MGHGTARGGHLFCNQDIRWVQFPYVPFMTWPIRLKAKLRTFQVRDAGFNSRIGHCPEVSGQQIIGMKETRHFLHLISPCSISASTPVFQTGESGSIPDTGSEHSFNGRKPAWYAGNDGSIPSCSIMPESSSGRWQLSCKQQEKSLVSSNLTSGLLWYALMAELVYAWSLSLYSLVLCGFESHWVYFGVVELVYTLDSNPGAARRASSTLVSEISPYGGIGRHVSLRNWYICVRVRVSLRVL